MDFPFWQIIGFPLREEVTPRNLRMENNCWKPCFSTQNALGTQDLWAYGETQSHNTKKTLWTQHTRVDSIRANVTCMTSPSRGPMLNRIQLRHIYIYYIYIYYIYIIYIHIYIYYYNGARTRNGFRTQHTHTPVANASFRSLGCRCSSQCFTCLCRPTVTHRIHVWYILYIC